MKYTKSKIVSGLALTLFAASASSFAQESPRSQAPIFFTNDVLQGISISAPLSDLYAKDRAFGPVQSAAPVVQAPTTHQTDSAPAGAPKRPSVIGTLSFLNHGQTVTLSNVEFSVRGNSSRAENQCPFAKLTLKIGDQKNNPLFGDLKEIKIGTHCGESEIPAIVWGRIQNQKEPIREALIYQVLNHMGVVTLHARPAVITYTDTSAALDPNVIPAQTITRNAFFVESEEEGAERYHAKVAQQTTPTAPLNPVFTDAQTAKVDPKNIILSALAEALTENGDWTLKMTANDSTAFSTNWNINILKTTTPDGSMMAQVYDWDLSGWVRGAWGASNTSIANAFSRMQQDPDVTEAVYEQVRAQVLATKTQAYADLAAAFAPHANALPDVDTEGEENIKNHLDNFFNAMTCQTQLSRVDCF